MNRALSLLLLLTACGDGGVQKLSGLEALLQVGDAQYFHGAFPKGSEGAPTIEALRVVSQTLRVGQTNRALSGSASGDAVSVALQLEGDPGYWTKPVGGADPILSGALSFDVNLGFSRFVTPGPHALVVAASSASGQWGVNSPLTFTFVDVNAAPPSQLEVRLSWDVDADLDLHLAQPDGTELWARKGTTYEPPVVGPVDQTAANAAAHLDFDSNASCALDGRRLERVLYGNPPPSGTYLVRVDTFSLCGQVAAHWKLEVFHQSELIATATGTALPASTRFPHERGSGALAAQFTLP